MYKRFILFIIPVVALLIMATALFFNVALSAHAAGITSKSTTTTVTAPAATKTTTGGGIKPAYSYSW